MSVIDWSEGAKVFFQDVARGGGLSKTRAEEMYLIPKLLPDMSDHKTTSEKCFKESVIKTSGASLSPSLASVSLAVVDLVEVWLSLLLIFLTFCSLHLKRFMFSTTLH